MTMSARSTIRRSLPVREKIPAECMAHIWGILPSHPSLLDLGCRSGTLTRMLAEKAGFLVGCDSDARALAEARRGGGEGITFCVSSPDRLPFGDKIFDGITALNSFHRLGGREALGEIARVLKPEGILVAVNLDDAGSFRKQYEAVLRKFIPAEVPDPRRRSDPKDILLRGKFRNVERRLIRSEEECPLEEALERVRSSHLWNLLPESREEEALSEIAAACTVSVPRCGTEADVVWGTRPA